MSIAELLRSRGLIDVEDIEVLHAQTTEEGLRYTEALPEERLVALLREHGGRAPIQMIIRVMGKELFGIALGWAKRRGWVRVENGELVLERSGDLEELRRVLKRFAGGGVVEGVDEEILRELVRRGLLKVERRRRRLLKLRPGAVDEARRLLELGEAVTYLTSELIATGRWRSVALKPYNVEAEPPRRYPGRKHFFKEFIEMVREVMYSLGFEEIRDDFVVPELWNFDALFQAQDHPSRDIHDTFVLGAAARLEPFAEIVERARRAHETGGDTGSRGWGYRWSEEKAARLILRSHTTAATIRWLSQHRDPPARGFIVSRVFRRDNMDARHLPEFTNFDGVIMERGFNFRKLLGLLRQIMRGLGFEKIVFKPSYFPFTEPSVEGYIYIEGFGWLELFGAGMFRPEVLYIAGVKHPVGAWGMGLERMVMALRGIDDIRELYSYNVAVLRKFVSGWF